MTLQERPLAVVTGASHGIGFAAAQHLASRGFDLVVNARSVTSLQKLQQRAASAGAHTTISAGDLRDSDVIDRLVESVQGRAIRILVACTGTLVDPDLEASVSSIDRERLREILDVTALLPIEVFRALSAPLRGGNAVFIASDWALPRSSGPSAFSAAKAAILQFARTEGRQSHLHGIRVSVLVPGDIATYDAAWEKPIWSLDNSTDEILAAFGGSRISLHEVVATLDLILTARTSCFDEIHMSPLKEA